MEPEIIIIESYIKNKFTQRRKYKIGEQIIDVTDSRWHPSWCSSIEDEHEKMQEICHYYWRIEDALYKWFFRDLEIPRLKNFHDILDLEENMRYHIKKLVERISKE